MAFKIYPTIANLKISNRIIFISISKYTVCLNIKRNNIINIEIV